MKKNVVLFTIPACEECGCQAKVSAFCQAPDIIDLLIGVSDELEAWDASEAPRFPARAQLWSHTLFYSLIIFTTITC